MSVETPSYNAVHDGIAMVRRFGSGTVHLAECEPQAFVATQWIGPPYWALHDPTVTLCGSVLNPDHRGLIAMREAHKVCTRCVRRSGAV